MSAPGLVPRVFEGKVALIINPAAGAGSAATHIRSVAHRAWPNVTVFLTNAPGHARTLAVNASEAGVELIVAAGGDGTVHEVADGIASTGRDVALGILPEGTGIDIARNLGIPRKLRLGDLLVATHERRIDLLCVGFTTPDGAERAEHAVNSVDAGIGAETATIIAADRARYRGRTAFLKAALQAIARHRAPRFAVTLDGQPLLDGPANIVVAANGPYFGGGMRVAPGAVLDDGLLDALALAATPRHELALNLLPRVYRGAHLSHRAVKAGRGQELVVTGPAPFPIELDGEPRQAVRVRVTVLPRALRVILPDDEPGWVPNLLRR